MVDLRLWETLLALIIALGVFVLVLFFFHAMLWGKVSGVEKILVEHILIRRKKPPPEKTEEKEPEKEEKVVEVEEEEVEFEEEGRLTAVKEFVKEFFATIYYGLLSIITWIADILGL